MTFEKRCREVAEACGLGEVLFCEDEEWQEPYIDDGFLHVVSRKGMRAVFNVSQDQTATSAQQNEKTRRVLTGLRLARYIGDRTLEEELEYEEGDSQ